MDWEQIYEFLQARGHTRIKTAELFQMLTNQRFLLRRLLQNSLGDNIGGRFLSNDQLRETVADMFQGIGYKAEARIVKNLLLHTENHAELGLGAHFTERPE